MRGFGILAAFLLFAALVCGVLPFYLMPEMGIAVGLPVIYVPGEKLFEFPIIGEFTNTMLGGVLTTIIGLLLVVPVAMNPQRVPGRVQAFVETLIGFFDDQTRSALGPKGRQVFPLMISIFMFLLIANVMKIVPGVDTVGLKHCAGIFPVGTEHTEENFVSVNGYPLQKGPLGISLLKVDEPLSTGTRSTYDDYHACEEAHAGGAEHSDSADHSEEATDHSEEAATTEESTDHSEEATTAEAGDQAAAPEEDHAEEEHLYMVTPFVRGASTDLTVTLSIALVAMVAVQFFGLKELGLSGYSVKFLNLPAVERAAAGQPIAVIDFAVGLLETVLEIMKVVSFAFRLFGAMFGGMILMFVITFLVGTLVPVAVVGLEVFIGVIQAYVFSILFLMFSAVAMTPHHHDDEHHDDEHHH